MRSSDGQQVTEEKKTCLNRALHPLSAEATQNTEQITFSLTSSVILLWKNRRAIEWEDRRQCIKAINVPCNEHALGLHESYTT